MNLTTSNIVAVVMATLIMGVPFYLPIGFYKQQESKLHAFLFPLCAVIAFWEYLLLWYFMLMLIW